MENSRRFWNRRFIKEGKIWGDAPSKSVIIATNLLRYLGLNKILVSGCAYGRNSSYLAESGFEVTGLDASPVGIDMAKDSAEAASLSIDYQVGNVYQLPFINNSFDAVFDRGLLHLMLRAERRQAIAEYRQVLKSNGVSILTVFSTDDRQYGKGVELEENTFDSMDGRPAHFFTKNDLLDILSGWQILMITSLRETETHGKGKHKHDFLFAIASPAKDAGVVPVRKIPPAILFDSPELEI